MSKPLYHPVKIGNVELKGNLFLAPVAGYSDAAFRSVCIENGACFTYTEMVSAEALVRKNLKTEILMRRACNEKAYSVQIFGGEPEIMAEAAQIVLEKTHCEVIDINCGCPVPKIIKTGAGSALTRDPERLFKVAEAVVKAAMKYIGRPYRHGTAGPNVFDCSGFTSFIYKQFDISLSRDSRAQYRQGVSVGRKDLRVGDLVFFTSPKYYEILATYQKCPPYRS